MDIQQTISSILLYYSSSRGTGHTRLMLDGIKQDPNRGYIVVINYAHGRQFKPYRVLPLSYPERWRGLRAPIVWDNYTIVHLLAECQKELKRLNELSRPRSIWQHIKRIVPWAQKRR